MARKQVFKHSFCVICSFFIYLLSIHDRDDVEAAIAATGPVELYFCSSHILNFDRHWHCKVRKFRTAESSSFHFCNSTHLILKGKNTNETNIIIGADFSFPPHSPTRAEVNHLLCRWKPYINVLYLMAPEHKRVTLYLSLAFLTGGKVW